MTSSDPDDDDDDDDDDDADDDDDDDDDDLDVFVVDPSRGGLNSADFWAIPPLSKEKRTQQGIGNSDASRRC